MKKTCLCILLIAVVSGASAQSSGIVYGSTVTTVTDKASPFGKDDIFSIRAGTDFSWYKANEDYQHNAKTKVGTGFHIEGIYERKLVQGLYLQAGLGLAYLQSGDNTWGDNSKASNGIWEQLTENYSLLYFRIPVAFNYKIRLSQNFAITPVIGIDFNVGLGGKKKEIVRGSDGYYSNRDYPNVFDEGGDFSRFNPDLNLGVQAEWRHLIVGLNAQIGMSNMLQKYLVELYEDELDAQPKFRRTGLSIIVGYRF